MSGGRAPQPGAAWRRAAGDASRSASPSPHSPGEAAGPEQVHLDHKTEQALAGEIDAVDKDDAVADLECSICTYPCFRRGIVTRCEHHFHRTCLEDAIKQRGRKCPMCRAELPAGNDCFRELSRLARGILNRAKVLCPQGCGAQVAFEQLSAHIHNTGGCLMTPLICSNGTCGAQFLRIDAGDHNAHCAHAIVSCGTCAADVRRAGLREHLEQSCPKVPIHCEYCKQDDIPRAEMEAHMLQCTATVPVKFVMQMQQRLQQQMEHHQMQMQQMQRDVQDIIDRGSLEMCALKRFRDLTLSGADFYRGQLLPSQPQAALDEPRAAPRAQPQPQPPRRADPEEWQGWGRVAAAADPMRIDMDGLGFGNVQGRGNSQPLAALLPKNGAEATVLFTQMGTQQRRGCDHQGTIVLRRVDNQLIADVQDLRGPLGGRRVCIFAGNYCSEEHIVEQPPACIQQLVQQSAQLKVRRAQQQQGAQQMACGFHQLTQMDIPQQLRQLEAQMHQQLQRQHDQQPQERQGMPRRAMRAQAVRAPQQPAVQQQHGQPNEYEIEKPELLPIGPFEMLRDVTAVTLGVRQTNET